jgi:hypothetical protein
MSDDFLVWVEFVVSDDDATAYRAERDVKLLGSKTNRLYIRRPRCSEVGGIDTDQTETRRVDLTFGVIPDPDCRITWIRFSVELTAGNAEQGEVPAVITDLTPRERTTSYQMTKSEKVEPEVGSGPFKISGEKSQTMAASVEEIVVEGYGIDSSAALWDFTSTNVRPLVGDQQVSLIVQRPRGTVLYGRFDLSARITTRLGNAIPLTKKTKEPLSATFRVC